MDIRRLSVFITDANAGGWSLSQIADYLNTELDTRAFDPLVVLCLIRRASPKVWAENCTAQTRTVRP